MNVLGKISLVMLFVACAVSAQAQQEWRFGITMGSLFPMGTFKGVDVADPNSGYSELGFSLNLDGDYYLNERISVGGRLNLSRAGIDSEAFGKQLDIWFADYLIEDQTRYDINSWSWNTVAVGIKGNLPFFSNKVFIEAGIFPGLAIPSVPDVNISIDDKENQQFVIGQSEKKTKVAFSAMGDLGFRFKISSQMQFALRGSYLLSKFSFDHVGYKKSYELNRTDVKIYDREMSVPVHALGVSVGLVYLL